MPEPNLWVWHWRVERLCPNCARA